MNKYETKKLQLQKKMKAYAAADLAVAFSGGTDSSLLLKLACEAAKKTGQKVYAVTLQTNLHPAAECETARRVAAEMGAEHLILLVDELSEAGIENNPPDRCYRCKRCLFQKLTKKAGALGAAVILDGTNADDLKEYRPGLKALKELGIRSPLADAGLTKQEVRTWASEYKISTASKPATPCLATRFPYGTVLTDEKLAKVERGEAFLKALGFYNVRLRVHGDLARIEVDAAALESTLSHREEITDYLKELGYTYVTLDLEGFCSGSMDIK